ncbi:hypothetical protein [Streptosporangium saharense]|uniref:hypothetical protein n=1 Tax=Streptosporangium saharense TaxID=1706840 RepID=UPI00331C65F4
MKEARTRGNRVAAAAAIALLTASLLVGSSSSAYALPDSRTVGYDRSTASS